MTKLKTMKMKLSVAITFAIIVGLVAVFGGVKAYQNYGDSPKVVVEGNYIEAGQTEQTEQSLGAMTGPDSPYLYESVNNDVVFHPVLPLDQTTSSFVSYLNPFGANSTATVEMVRLEIRTAASSTTAATTTYACGASATANGSPAYYILSSDIVGIASSSIVMENGISSSYGPAIGGGSVNKIMLTQTYPYLVCGSSISTGFTNSSLVGRVTARISKTRY